jgi:hypothetical protein
MGPSPGDSASHPSPPASPPSPPLRGGPPGTGVPGRPWWHWAAIAGGALVVALVILAVVLATRTPQAPAPVAIATPSPTVTASPTTAPTPTATPGPTPTPTPSPTAAPLPKTPAQQAALLYPSGGVECGSPGGHYSSCPVTPALIAAANAWIANHSPSPPAPLCRCPVSYASVLATQNDTLLPAGDQGNTNLAAVEVHLSFPPKSETMVVLFARQADGTWLAFDTYCGNPQNRLGAPAATSCIQ